MNQFFFANNQNNLLSNNSETNNEIVRNMNIFENKLNWKKTVSDKLVRRMMKYREERIDNVRLNKEDIINEVRCEQMIIDDLDEESQILSHYFDKIQMLFENECINSGEYEMEMHQNSSVSICPICYYPVILTSKKIICLNLCFEFSIPPNLINQNFTLDNFVDILGRTYRNHQNCLKSVDYGLQLLIFEDNLNIVCGKCFSEYL